MSPKIRQSFYYLSSIITSVIGLALLYGGIKTGTASNITEILAGLGGLLGATGPALAGKKVGEQVKDGVLASDPTTQIANGIQEVQKQLDAARAQAEAAKAIVADVFDDIPVLGPLATEALTKIKF